MSTADPTDLRLASALAESGRAPVAQLAARAGINPEEAAGAVATVGDTLSSTGPAGG